ncbi:MAG TPA: hypothetical protein QGF35_08160 [Dehalococcoidia bacterium]|nr:hypothetical protein [Dehalococcoidia bacterium]
MASSGRGIGWFALGSAADRQLSEGAGETVRRISADRDRSFSQPEFLWKQASG